MTAAMIETAAPAWATRTIPETDTWTIHNSDEIEVAADGPDGPHTFRIALSEEVEDGKSKGVMVAMLSMGDWVDLTPTHVMDFIEQLRDLAVTGAGAEGIEIPAERVRLGDELLGPNGWDVVEMVDVDGCLIEGHPSAINISTTAHDGESGYRLPLGAPVRVRKAVTR
jgi:hypothetical protein